MADGNKRGAERSAVMLMAVVRFAGERGAHRLRVRDIAPGGVRLAFAGDVAVGVCASVQFPALGPVRGTVVWAAGGAVGIRFAEPIDPERARLAVGGDFRPAPGPAAPALLRRV